MEQKNISSELTAAMDKASAQVLTPLKKSCSFLPSDGTKLYKAILLVNIIATVLLIIGLYSFPAVEFMRGHNVSFNQALTFLGMAPGYGFTAFLGNLFIIACFANLALGVYLYAKEEAVPYVTVRLMSLFLFVVMLLMTFIMPETVFGIYILLVFSILIGFTGFLIPSKIK